MPGHLLEQHRQAARRDPAGAQDSAVLQQPAAHGQGQRQDRLAGDMDAERVQAAGRLRAVLTFRRAAAGHDEQVGPRRGQPGHGPCGGAGHLAQFVRGIAASRAERGRDKQGRVRANGPGDEHGVSLPQL